MSSIERTEWFKRVFPKIDDQGRIPTIMERLRDSPFRLARNTSKIDDQIASKVVGGKWTIKKEIGHLIDLEPLWYGRVQDLINSVEVLREADLTNAKTHNADHDSRSMDALLAEFKDLRYRLIDLVESLSIEQIEHTALHPRLKTPMQLVDLLYFVAEHDDHHLNQISWLKSQ